MQEFIFRFKVKTPDGGKDYYQSFFGGEMEARSAAKKLCEIYQCNVEIFLALGRMDIESYECKVKFVDKSQDLL